MPESLKDYSLSVFFPFYNEEANLRSVIEEAIAVLESLTELTWYEVIIVNDGSQDKTGAIAQELKEKYAAVKLITHDRNQGYGAALLSGFHGARGDYVFFSDGDRQFDLKEISKLLVYLPEYQAVIGYRSPRRDPWFRSLNARLWGLFNRLLLGLKVRDIDCAFKLFKRELVATLPLNSTGAMLSVELLVRLQRQGVVFKEVPVNSFPRVAGEATGAKLKVIIRAFQEFWRFYSQS
jgi:glycosyltransferase involved in cell wall biosynthesis